MEEKVLSEKKYHRGYTQGVFDMFHIGHLNLLNRAKAQCDYLIVGVNSDHLVEKYKRKTPVIPEGDREKIVENIKAVDEAHIVDTLDKLTLLKAYPFDAVFIGSDWKGTERWNRTERDLRKRGIDVVYLPYTKEVSSSQLRPKMLEHTDLDRKGDSGKQESRETENGIKKGAV